jgi:hypothetical protein
MLERVAAALGTRRWDAAKNASISERRTRYLRPGRVRLPGRLAVNAPDWIQVLTVSGMTWSRWATCSLGHLTRRYTWPTLVPLLNTSQYSAVPVSTRPFRA